MPPPLCFAGAGCSDSASPIQSNLQEPLDSSGGHRVLSWTRSLTRFAEYFADLERGYLGFSGIEQGDTDAWMDLWSWWAIGDSWFWFGGVWWGESGGEGWNLVNREAIQVTLGVSRIKMKYMKLGSKPDVFQSDGNSIRSSGPSLLLFTVSIL